MFTWKHYAPKIGKSEIGKSKVKNSLKGDHLPTYAPKDY